MVLYKFINAFAILAHDLTVKKLMFFQNALDDMLEIAVPSNTDNKPIKLTINGKEEIVPHSLSPRYVADMALVPEYISVNNDLFTEVQQQELLQLRTQTETSKQELYNLVDKFQQSNLIFSMKILEHNLAENSDAIFYLFKNILPECILDDRSLLETVFKEAELPTTLLDLSDDKTDDNLAQCLQEIVAEIKNQNCNLKEDTKIQELYSTMLLFQVS